MILLLNVCCRGVELLSGVVIAVGPSHSHLVLFRVFTSKGRTSSICCPILSMGGRSTEKDGMVSWTLLPTDLNHVSFTCNHLIMSRRGGINRAVTGSGRWAFIYYFIYLGVYIAQWFELSDSHSRGLSLESYPIGLFLPCRVSSRVSCPAVHTTVAVNRER